MLYDYNIDNKCDYYPRREAQAEGYGNHIVCLCVCVCLFANFWENYVHWRLKRATGRLQIIQGTKITRDFC